MAVEGFSIVQLAGTHARDDFDCGVERLNQYLQAYARQDVARGAASVYVATLIDAPTEIAGYYTLAATAIRLSALPPNAIKKLPRYPMVPSTLLGRLAVTRRNHGRGLGEWLLLDALRRSLDASTTVGSSMVIVDAKNDAAALFYERYGFIRLPQDRSRLVITMKTIDLARRAVK